MFVQQEVHRRDIDAVVMGWKMTSCLLMFVRRASHGASRQQLRLFLCKILHLKPHPNFAVAITNSLMQYCNTSRGY